MYALVLDLGHVRFARRIGDDLLGEGFIGDKTGEIMALAILQQDWMLDVNLGGRLMMAKSRYLYKTRKLLMVGADWRVPCSRCHVAAPTSRLGVGRDAGIVKMWWES